MDRSVGRMIPQNARSVNSFKVSDPPPLASWELSLYNVNVHECPKDHPFSLSQEGRMNRPHIVSFRLNETERIALRLLAARDERTISDVLRRLVIEEAERRGELRSAEIVAGARDV